MTYIPALTHRDQLSKSVLSFKTVNQYIKILFVEQRNPTIYTVTVAVCDSTTNPWYGNTVQQASPLFIVREFYANSCYTNLRDIRGEQCASAEAVIT